MFVRLICVHSAYWYLISQFAVMFKKPLQTHFNNNALNTDGLHARPRQVSNIEVVEVVILKANDSVVHIFSSAPATDGRCDFSMST